MKTLIFSFIFCASIWAAPLLQDMESCLQNGKMEKLTELLLKQGGELKNEGDWNEHIHYAEKAIEYCRKQKKPLDLAHISNQVASTYFYRGDYSICRQKALDAYEIFSSQNQKEGEIASLYLLSAASRGLQEYNAAISFGSIAQQILLDNKLKVPTLEGKVLYNLAATYMEKDKPDLDKAEDLLKGALTQFQSDEHSLYPQRIQIRLAKIHYLKNEVDEALDVLLSLGSEITQKRLKMHYYFLLSQTYYKKREKGLALQAGEKAHAIALGLSARADLARYDEWIQKLKSNR